MSGITKKLMGTTAAAGGVAGGGGGDAELDVFVTDLYSGNGGTQTITNGIDFAGQGGAVWIKARDAPYPPHIFDTVRDNGYLETSGSGPVNSAGGGAPPSSGIHPFNSDGFTFADGLVYWNGSGIEYVAWSMRRAARFFDVVTYTGNGVSGRAIGHNLGIAPGFMMVKKVNKTRAFISYHRSLGGTYYLENNNINAAGIVSTVWADTDPTGTVFTVGDNASVNTNGDDYVAYLFAHDPFGPSGDDGLIACGSYTGNGSTSGPQINLGWKPQWLLIKRTDLSGNWRILDKKRGVGATDALLCGNDNATESTDPPNFSEDNVDFTSTGFKLKTGTRADFNELDGNYIYIAIRDPNA